MIAQPKSVQKTTLLAVSGMAAVVLGLGLVLNLVTSMPVQGKSANAAPLGAPSTVGHQQPIIVSGRPVYTAPIVTGPTATAILQGMPANAIAYVVHTFAGQGKSVATVYDWFRCADVVSSSQYNGNQTEIEIWALLTEQERLEIQAACSL
ncbi:MAG: hypothetical protein R3E79_48350 [Caldilineaceae bacterium]